MISADEGRVKEMDKYLFWDSGDTLIDEDSEVRLPDEAKPNIYMIGNNMKRDILGANRFGIHSVLMDWSLNYVMEPDNEEEIPEFRVHNPMDVIELIERTTR